MTEAQIKHMVDRFLAWRLPEDFRPDAGISFDPEFNKEWMAKEGKPPMRREPVGTNLLNYPQAEAMVRHMIEGMPDHSSDPVKAAGDRDARKPHRRRITRDPSVPPFAKNGERS